MAKAQVGVQAIQLYDYMVHNREVSTGRTEDLLVFKVFVSNFTNKYKVWLKELEGVGWIKSSTIEDICEGNPSSARDVNVIQVFILGKVKTVYFRDSGDLEKENLLSQYQDQRSIIEKVLNAVGSLRRSGTLTEKQTLAELKYFDKYPREVVIKSAQVYLSLPIDKQHGERYLRGIMRNEEAQSNGRLQKTESPIVTRTSPIADHIRVQDKNNWIRANIDSELFDKMNNDDQAEYIRQLESDYESTRDN